VKLEGNSRRKRLCHRLAQAAGTPTSEDDLDQIAVLKNTVSLKLPQVQNLILLTIGLKEALRKFMEEHLDCFTEAGTDDAKERYRRIFKSWQETDRLYANLLAPNLETLLDPEDELQNDDKNSAAAAASSSSTSAPPGY
jgi:hypothetical protein